MRDGMNIKINHWRAQAENLQSQEVKIFLSEVVDEVEKIQSLFEKMHQAYQIERDMRIQLVKVADAAVGGFSFEHTELRHEYPEVVEDLEKLQELVRKLSRIG